MSAADNDAMKPPGGQVIPSYSEARVNLSSMGSRVTSKSYSGLYRCRGCFAESLGATICFIPCCECCLWGVWGFRGIPCPALGCVTFCLCKQGSSYITEKAGMTTGELVLVDEKTGTLAMYGIGGDCTSMSEEAQCYCTK
mmetsp:Transcript_25000/g.30237  ORF Transcript_25000/g.30237 Transcript_25000/m.30237 type:complete len:140 (+) Transcript_25000:187-606(+)|eukprot:CAMPEP_0197857542 /NCGR_PEP_ID=MMETSP1438-20131217/30706_1 /TAXON_ID=1461541 /ORGANISM="Pterosperma sp., Strain CCMP1384" /LENGTH=139 /DNA_ID=CAMNT_0043473409 /DNA_START=187 /DNA_END=606 /DNA_ORIENTATION=+